MAATLTYKGYIAELDVDLEDNFISGSVINVPNGVTFQGNTVPEAREKFQQAIEFYLDWCKENRVEAEKPYSGRILFRTSPLNHRDLVQAAKREGATSFNAWMQDHLVRRAQLVLGKIPPSAEQSLAAAGSEHHQIFTIANLAEIMKAGSAAGHALASGRTSSAEGQSASTGKLAKPKFRMRVFDTKKLLEAWASQDEPQVVKINVLSIDELHEHGKSEGEGMVLPLVPLPPK